MAIRWGKDERHIDDMRKLIENMNNDIAVFDKEFLEKYPEI